MSLRPPSWDPKDVVPDSGSGTHCSHPSTNQSRPCLASEIRRDRAHSGWYGRRLGTHSQGWVSLGCACGGGRLHVRQCPWGWLGVLAAAYSDLVRRRRKAQSMPQAQESWGLRGSWVLTVSAKLLFQVPLPSLSATLSFRYTAFLPHGRNRFSFFCRDGWMWLVVLTLCQ